MSRPILDVRDLRIDFETKRGRVNAVNGINFSLLEKQTLGVVGESGCGKSVSMLSIMKLLPARTAIIDPNASIKLNGRELSTLSNRAMCGVRGKEISMIFQDPMTSLNPVMTVGKQIMETICAHKRVSRASAYEQAVDMLRQVGVSDAQERMKAYPHQLSGGMRQRIMIAMALVCKPQVLIADEPTTALDVTIQAQILDLLRELKQEINTSIILITHDLGVVAEMADEIIVMYAGEIVEQGSAEDIFQNALHPYTKGLLNSMPTLTDDRERLYTIRGTVPNLQDMPTGCRFCERCELATARCRLEEPQMAEFGGHKVRCMSL